jgi:hypothetical protein
MSDNAEPRPPIRRITHRYGDWSLEWSLLSAVIVGGAIGLCGVVAVVLWISSGGGASSAVARPTAIVLTVTPSPIVPTPTPSPEPTASPTPEGLYAGGYAQVSGTQGDDLRLRSDPGLQTTTLKTVPEGARLHILDGPRDADGLTWWRLRDLSDGAEGWAAQLYLIPTSP